MGTLNDAGALTSRRSGTGMGSARVSLKQKTLIARPFHFIPAA